MISMEFRHGIGIDFEFNENICYRVGLFDEEGKELAGEHIMCYIGHIIRLPLMTIYIGEFAPIEEMSNFGGFNKTQQVEEKKDDK
jgi:hypothetical protein